ncbi:hypothetical protein ACFLRM_01625 [Acidobacteriota bacterium]
MKTTMVIPSYWGREKNDGWKNSDTVYDHPTPLDEEGTLGRVLDSLAILENKDFSLVILGVATAEDIRDEVASKISSVLKISKLEVPTYLFSYSHLNTVHRYLNEKGKNKFTSLLQLDGYSNVRNLCTFLPHLLGSELAVLIDDDEIFEDPLFMDKASEFIGQDHQGDRLLSIAGYYVNPDNDFFLNRSIEPWMTHWNKFDCMNRAFKKIIATGPRLKETPFAFGGNLLIHRNLFTLVPFDPNVPRGEDIDFLINCRMFGYKTYLDNELSIKHDPPPKSYPAWRRLQEDIFRFVFEKTKLEAQNPVPGMNKVFAKDLDPYPGEFLKEDLGDRIFRSNQMMAIDYLSQGEKKGAQECMNNIYLANTQAIPSTNPFHNLLQLQKDWKNLMDFFSSDKVGKEVCSSLCFPRN